MELKHALEDTRHRFKPLLNLVSKKKKRKIKENLKYTNIDPETYLEITLGTATALTLILTGLIITQNPITGPGYGLILFSFLYLIILSTPKLIKNKTNREMEKTMARAVRTIATELNINTPFHTCIAHATNQDTPAAKELQKAQKEVKRGASYPEALSKLSKRHKSKFIKKTMNQLISAHAGDTKKGSEALKNLAKEQEAILRSQMENYNQKLVMYSLIFIATSAILPAMFQALVIIGSNFLNLSITPSQALLIPSIGFPTLNIGIFAYVTAKKP